jgi:hypothetical protein
MPLRCRAEADLRQRYEQHSVVFELFRQLFRLVGNAQLFQLVSSENELHKHSVSIVTKRLAFCDA